MAIPNSPSCFFFKMLLAKIMKTDKNGMCNVNKVCVHSTALETIHDENALLV